MAKDKDLASIHFDNDTLNRIGKSVVFTENFQRNYKTHLSHYSFELLTDAAGGQAVARITSLDEAILIQEIAMFKYKWGVLDDARAGYKGDCKTYGGVYYFEQGPCVVKCFTDASLSSGSAPDAIVDEVYTHTVSASDIEAGSITATGLPDGLTIDPDTGEITGTPTEVGEYFVIVKATGEKTGPGVVVEGATCDVTVGFILKVVEPEV